MWKVRQKKYYILGIGLALVMGSGLLCNELHKLQNISTNCSSPSTASWPLWCAMKQRSRHQFHPAPEAPGFAHESFIQQMAYKQRNCRYTHYLWPQHGPQVMQQLEHLTCSPQQVPFQLTTTTLQSLRYSSVRRTGTIY